MMRSLTITLLFIFAGFIGANAQMLKQQNMAKWGIPAGNYSGITPLGGNRYAVVSDKAESDGFFIFDIDIDPVTGKVLNMTNEGFRHNTGKARDVEDIVYANGHLYINAEDDQRIIEYDTLGNRTGREMDVPQRFAKDKIYSNYGFEALAFSEKTGLFWTCTENSLKEDRGLFAPSYAEYFAASLRLQAFDSKLKSATCATNTFYDTEKPVAKRDARQFAFGVPAMTFLDDGSLLVLEREFFVAKNYIGSYVKNVLCRLSPQALENFKKDDARSYTTAVVKDFLCEWTTRLNLTKRNLANYEGMCLGPKLNDGRQTLILISDSQNGYGNSVFHLKDYIKVIVF